MSSHNIKLKTITTTEKMIKLGLRIVVNFIKDKKVIGRRCDLTLALLVVFSFLLWVVVT